MSRPISSNPGVSDGPKSVSGRLDEYEKPPTQVPVGGRHTSRELPGTCTVVVVRAVMGGRCRSLTFGFQPRRSGENREKDDARPRRMRR